METAVTSTLQLTKPRAREVKWPAREHRRRLPGPGSLRPVSIGGTMPRRPRAAREAGFLTTLPEVVVISLDVRRAKTF